MITGEENELLCRVGPGTLMGELLRQYWTPVIFSSELEKDGPPKRVRLLGENLIAFRETQGRVGLLADNCSHRGASLFFGRNEEGGVRCVYHGWKYDVEGRCVDMPNEPPESNFKEKIQHVAYPCQEHGGVIWTYMGPRREPPLFPDLEWTKLPPENRNISQTLRQCNWMQGLEGDIDTSHLYFLHSRLEAGDKGRVGAYHPDKSPRLEIVPTDYGVKYGARRVQDENNYYWRITQYMMPFHTLFPPGGAAGVPGHIWVPLDDYNHIVWSLIWKPDGPIPSGGGYRGGGAGGYIDPGYMEQTTDWLGRWRNRANATNDYMIDREKQRTVSFTGIPTIPLQDTAVTESMGPVFDRTREHLGTSDTMIIQVRRILLNAAKALRELGVTPPGVDHPELYRVHSASVVLPKEVSWVEATEETLKAFTELPVASL